MNNGQLKYLWALLLALLFAGCEKDEPTPTLTVSSQQTVMLSNTIGSQAAFTVTASGAWTATVTGTDFDLSATSGSKGETTVTVTATKDNSERTPADLGNITLHISRGTDCTLSVVQAPAVVPQTVLIYMPGQGLLSFFKDNIAAIQEAVNNEMPGFGRILLCYQPTSQNEADLYEIRYDALQQSCVMEQIKSYTDFSAAEPADVEQIFDDVQLQAPADRYGLFICCHGKAWVPASAGYLPSAGLTPIPQHDIWTPAPGAAVTRSFGDPGRELDIPTLASILEDLPYRFDYLIFDDCFMANVETLYDLRHATDYVIASPCEVMGAGFPYTTAVPPLFLDRGQSHDLQQVCEAFYDFYSTTTTTERSGCISLAVMSQMDALADVMRQINAAPHNSYNPADLQAYEGLYRNGHLFFDLGNWVTTICSDPALLDAFEAQLDRTFPTEDRLYTPTFYSALGNGGTHPTPDPYSGVSISEPSTYYVQENEQTAWYKATHR